MEKPVIISIRGVQTLEEGQEDVMELVTQGILRQEEGELSLTYLESELTGLEAPDLLHHPGRHRNIVPYWPGELPDGV